MYAELVCGPPGSGKTTYVEGRRQYLTARSGFDPRVVVTVNLDPANDGVFPYPCDVDIGSLIEHRSVMEMEGLGPNGGYLFCVDYLAAHTDWLCDELARMAALRSPDALLQGIPVWYIIDCPGQVEFYVHSQGLSTVVKALQKKLNCAVVMNHLCDGIIATRDVATYVSTCLLCLSCMADLELPHVNVLTKWDTVEAEDADGESTSFLESGTFLEDHFNRLWRRDEKRGIAAAAAGSTRSFARSVLDVVSGYGFGGFESLDVQSEASMRRLGDRIDMAAGLVR